MLYSYAKLSKYDLGFVRFLGTGLGNLLFPWARCLVISEKYGLKRLEPTWPQFKIGPILRKELDTRFYGDLFLSPASSVNGVQKIFLLATKKKIDESVIWNQPEILNKIEDGILVFEGCKNYFKDISHDYQLIRRELLNITRPIHKIGLDYDFSNCVCLHIRRGDFKIEGWDTSMKWFLWIMDELKRKISPNLNFKIFSDGSDSELFLILKQKNTERLFFGSALADLLAMSCSKIFVGSFNSTFSMWASYLGRMPTIWPKKNLFQPEHYENPNFAEISCGEALQGVFLEHCKNFLN
jgi:hypothetical protein